MIVTINVGTWLTQIDSDCSYYNAFFEPMREENVEIADKIDLSKWDWFPEQWNKWDILRERLAKYINVDIMHETPLLYYKDIEVLHRAFLSLPDGWQAFIVLDYTIPKEVRMNMLEGSGKRVPHLYMPILEKDRDFIGGIMDVFYNLSEMISTYSRIYDEATKRGYSEYIDNPDKQQTRRVISINLEPSACLEKNMNIVRGIWNNAHILHSNTIRMRDILWNDFCSIYNNLAMNWLKIEMDSCSHIYKSNWRDMKKNIYYPILTVLNGELRPKWLSDSQLQVMHWTMPQFGYNSYINREFQTISLRIDNKQDIFDTYSPLYAGAIQHYRSDRDWVGNYGIIYTVPSSCSVELWPGYVHSKIGEMCVEILLERYNIENIEIPSHVAKSALFGIELEKRYARISSLAIFYVVGREHINKILEKLDIVSDISRWQRKEYYKGTISRFTCNISGDIDEDDTKITTSSDRSNIVVRLKVTQIASIMTCTIRKHYDSNVFPDKMREHVSIHDIEELLDKIPEEYQLNME